MAGAIGEDFLGEDPIPDDNQLLRDWPRWRRAGLSYEMLEEVSDSRADVALAQAIGTKAAKSTLSIRAAASSKPPISISSTGSAFRTSRRQPS